MDEREASGTNNADRDRLVGSMGNWVRSSAVRYAVAIVASAVAASLHAAALGLALGLALVATLRPVAAALRLKRWRSTELAYDGKATSELDGRYHSMVAHTAVALPDGTTARARTFALFGAPASLDGDVRVWMRDDGTPVALSTASNAVFTKL